MTANQPIRILSLEDMPSDAELQRVALQRADLLFDWVCVDNESNFKRQINEFRPDVILADYNLPSYDGTEALAFVQANHPSIPVIIVTGTLGEIKAVQLMKGGAVDYILKDRLIRLPEAVRHAVENARVAEERKLSELKLIESEKKLKASLVDFVASLASIVEMRDPYTAGHQRRVAQLAVAIARELELPEQQIEGIHLAGIVHDVGKIKIPAEILSKPGRLTDLEFQMIKQHSMAGYEILKSGDFPWPIAKTVLQHHERQDGSGYPLGIKNNEIIIEARILSVADVVEAISSHRPYRPGLGVEAALAEIAHGRDITYDPQVVDACIAVFKERGYVIGT